MPASATGARPKTAAKVDSSDLQTLLGYNAQSLWLQVIELFNNRMAGYELSRVDFSMLSLIHHNPGITSRQLCNTLSLLPPNLAGKISLMEKRDLLTRVQHPDDGLAIGLHLTTAGSQMMQHAEATATQLELDVSSKLYAADATTLLRLLQKVYL